MSGSAVPALPAGWTWTTFGDVALYLNGRAFRPSEWGDSGRPIIRIQNLTGSSQVVNRYSGDLEDRYHVRDGDLLISWSATLDAFIYRGEDAALNQHIFRAVPFVDKAFLYYVTKAYIATLRGQVHGSGMQHITKGPFEHSRLPLPPLSEQVRIVSKIEELLSDLDAAVEQMKEARRRLKAYRQAVLRDAFTGKLTQAWREEQLKDPESPLRKEPASALLERIGKEREKTEGKRKRRKLPPLDRSELPELPEGWVWARLGDLAKTVTKGTTPTSYGHQFLGEGIPFIRVESIADGRIDHATVRTFISQSVHEGQARSQLEPGDVLYTIAGTIGRTCLVTGNDVPANTNQAVAIIRGLGGVVQPTFLRRQLESHMGRVVTERARGGAMNNVSLGDLLGLSVAVAHPAEQNVMVPEIDRRFSLADALEQSVERSLKRAEQLRQSILKRAFEGKLVPQDPGDEPAEKLLERIRAERERKARRKQGLMNKNRGRRRGKQPTLPTDKGDEA